jgi:hypothetical protein
VTPWDRAWRQAPGPINRHGRIVLVPSKVEPEVLFRHRSQVNSSLCLEEMDAPLKRSTT